MWAFQYKHGDRPLEGYTIQRAAGRGGFGEVYYAVSDSGREVALKVVQGYQDIELRGISQCMNLKSPHLVTIFDVKYNAEAKPFVIMEYVSGPNLRQVIDESPAGLGTQKAAFFLREIAKGLSFLHDCGIVHRDLKPANIFYENGYVKIGDYGLSKAITTSQHSGQTVTVGTVHYMAPEIGAGKYDRSIDIYALGAVLYELLTGMPPYVGASPTEVLMKHLSSEPDISNIPQPFARVIQRAMAKDPTQRYQSVQAMVEDVFGAEHVRQSVSVFSPEDLSIIAERVAKKSPVAVGAGGGGGEGTSSSLPGGQADPWARVGGWMDEMGGRMRHAWHAQPGGSAGAGASPVPQVLITNDPLANRHRWQLALLVSLLAPLAAMLVRPNALGLPILSFLFVFTTMWGAAAGLMIAHRTIIPRMGNDSVWVQRLIAGQAAALLGILASLPTWAASGNARSMGATLLAIFIQFFLFDTKKEMSPDRAERVQFGHLFGAGLVAFIACMMFRARDHVQLAIAAAAGISLIVQILSPWDPAAGARTKKKEEQEENGEETDSSAAAATPQAPAPPAFAAFKVDPRHGTVEPIFVPTIEAEPQRRTRRRYWSRPVIPAARIAWLIGFALLIPLGIVLCVGGANERNPADVGPLVAGGVSLLIFGVFCALQALRETFYGWWSYLVKPALMAACPATMASSGIIWGNLWYPPQTEEVMLATFFIVFPVVLFLVLLFIPGKFLESQQAQLPTSDTGISRHRRSWALVLCLIFFLIPAGGLHRLYVGRIGSGILWLATFGLLFVGQIIDAILILSGKFTDAAGRPVLAWEMDAPIVPPRAPTPIPAAAPGYADQVRNVVDSIKAGAQSAGARIASIRLPSSVMSRPPIVLSADFNFRGIFSALAGLFIFVATLAALALAVDVPGMLHAGVPTPEVKQDLEADFFSAIPDQWPQLMRQAGMLAVGILVVASLTMLMFARRSFGVMHMLRGVVGVMGLLLAMVPLSQAFQRQGGWIGIGAYVSHKQYAEAVNQVLQNFQTSDAVVAAVIFLVSIIILSWPPRKATPEPAAPKGA